MKSSPLLSALRRDEARARTAGEEAQADWYASLITELEARRPDPPLSPPSEAPAADSTPAAPVEPAGPTPAVRWNEAVGRCHRATAALSEAIAKFGRGAEADERADALTLARADLRDLRTVVESALGRELTPDELEGGIR